MPELPEVQTVVDTLNNLGLNQKITKINILWDNIIATDINEFKKVLVTQSITNISRIGKIIIFELNDYIIASHLRMEGKYFVKEIDEELFSHDHVEIYLETKKLVYNDTRKFGKMYLLKKENYRFEKPFTTLGYEPWEIEKKWLVSKFSNLNIPIKSALLNQNYLVGLGNIYVDEVLFYCKIHPETKTKNISQLQIQEIIKNACFVLEFAISLGGTTIKSYTSSLGVSGRFQNELKVHTKKGEPCPNCQSEIIKIKVGGRGTYLCPKCQKL